MPKSRTQEINDVSDRINLRLTAAAAIADAAKVLTALERSHPAHKDADGMRTGDGFAAGHELRDKTLPDLLHHAAELIEDAKRDVDLMRDKASAPDIRAA